MTMITPSYLGETIEYSSLHACRSTLEDPTCGPVNAVCDLVVFPVKSKATARSIWKYRVRAVSRSRSISQRRTREEQARHTRREKESSNSHTTRCSNGTEKWPYSLAISRSGLLKRQGSKETNYRKNPERKPSARPVAYAPKRSMGDATVGEVKAEFEKRVQAGEFIETSNCVYHKLVACTN